MSNDDDAVVRLWDTGAPDFDFRHLLHNTITLLGGDKVIAELLKKSQDGQITRDDCDKVADYNLKLFTEVKMRLANLSTVKIQVKKSETD